MANVLFSKMSAAKFATITKDNGTFYRVQNTDGTQDLYLGEQKLNNAADLQNAIDGLTANDVAYAEGTVKDILDTLLGSVGDEGSIAKMINDAITGLTGSATIASKSGNTITIKAGVTEADGEIANTSDADITLADVASTGAAADVSVADAGGNLDATNVEAALAEIVGKINDADSDAKVTMEKLSGNNVVNSDNVAEYNFYQGVTQSDDAAAKAAKKIGTIELAKDLVATSGTLVNEDGEGNEGTFIEMTIANGTPFYINVADLIEYNQFVSGTEIVFTDNNHTITATIGEIAASKIVYREADNSDPENPIAKETVAQAINRLETAVDSGVDAKIATAIGALDANVDAALGAGDTDTEAVAVVSGVTEVDGVITGVDSTAADAAGAATRAKTAVIGVSTDEKTANTVYGAKAYADDAADTAKSDVIGTVSDAKTANTVNGAKAYADDAVATALTWNEVE